MADNNSKSHDNKSENNNNNSRYYNNNNNNSRKDCHNNWQQQQLVWKVCKGDKVAESRSETFSALPSQHRNAFADSKTRLRIAKKWAKCVEETAQRTGKYSKYFYRPNKTEKLHLITDFMVVITKVHTKVIKKPSRVIVKSLKTLASLS